MSRQQRLETGTSGYHSFLTVDDAPGIVVPQKIYANRSITDELRSPVIFPPKTYLHLAVTGALAHDASYQHREATCNADRLKFTLRLEWPGYAAWSSVIQGRERASSPEPVRLSVLAERVAHAVQKFYEVHRGTQTGEPSWAVDAIPFDRLILLQLVQVTQGSWQPVLCYDA